MSLHICSVEMVSVFIQINVLMALAEIFSERSVFSVVLGISKMFVIAKSYTSLRFTDVRVFRRT